MHPFCPPEQEVPLKHEAGGLISPTSSSSWQPSYVVLLFIHKGRPASATASFWCSQTAAGGEGREGEICFQISFHSDYIGSSPMYDLIIHAKLKEIINRNNCLNNWDLFCSGSNSCFTNATECGPSRKNYLS